jgi:hypothetical protein
LKISAIFADYDGTLAPEDVSLESSRVPKEIEEPLVRLGTSMPIAMVTSKDFGFIRPRTGFASAWACVFGLEIALSDGRAFLTERVSRRLLDGLTYAKRYERQGLALEEKRSTTGELLGFSMDWRRGTTPSSQFIKTVAAELTKTGLTVIHDPGRPYLDVFGARPNKGRAVMELKRLLKVTGNIMFMGDSAADNPGFEEAEVAICVEHGQSLENLACGFVVRHRDLGGFFQSLADDDLSLDLRALRRK